VSGAPPTFQRLLNLAQEGIPLTPRPFAEMGRACGLSEGEALAMMEQAYAEGLVRETSAIFDAAALGYKSTLAAMRVPPERLERAAACVSRHPGVSHNYARDHAYNLWFTLAAPGTANIEMELRRLSEEAGGWPFHSFPTLKRYKIGVRFDLTGNSASSGSSAADAPSPIVLDEETRRAVRALQDDLPRTPRPFAVLAAREAMTEERLIEAARRLAASGAMRRLASVVRHRAAGYVSNVMSAWDVAEHEMDRAGEALAALPSVSHCYRRPSYSDWPYELFAMIHTRSEEATAAVVSEAESAITPRRYLLLRSVREFKKERIRFFRA